MNTYSFNAEIIAYQVKYARTLDELLHAGEQVTTFRNYYKRTLQILKGVKSVKEMKPEHRKTYKDMQKAVHILTNVQKEYNAKLNNF